ncbi:RluA family pseudouridine synthase [Treponema sp. J25]|uniref:RluA family pseudouridine synthase n=1 Tax=Treponema sp. J25 TaxID=2094121 RepID=UPI001050AACC|nr:RluA family pseudouridine synthase [Treponema sp. J25]TCW60854.1 RluA family pseudouridine synthase [Treponema sp. J25]
MIQEFIIQPNDEGRRIDRILRKVLPDLPLSAIHRLLRSKKVFLNGKAVLAGDRVQAGMKLEIDLARPPLVVVPGGGRQKSNVPSGSIPLEILWECPDFMAIYKPAGIPVHGPGSVETRMVPLILKTIPPSLSFRPGPLHRLDQGTSGILLFSKSLRGAQVITEAFRQRRLTKWYLAILEGVLPTTETWCDVLLRNRQERRTQRAREDQPQRKAQEARTLCVPLSTTQGYTLAALTIETGRTHQIRAQAAVHGRPLMGDAKYGAAPFKGGFFLHAYEIQFPDNLPIPHPPFLRAPIPPLFKTQIHRLFGEKVLLQLDRNPFLNPL